MRVTRPHLPIEEVRTPDDTERLLARLYDVPGYVSLDTEWYDFDKDKGPVNNGRVLCAQLSWDQDGAATRVFVHNVRHDNLRVLAPWLRSPEYIKMAHNVQADWHAIANHGIICEGLVIDTLVMDFFFDENRENMHGLKECAHDHLGRDRLSYKKTFGKPVLRKDGLPYADGRLEEVDLLAVYNECWPEDGSPGNPATRKKLLEYATNDSVDALDLFDFVYLPYMQGTSWAQDGRNYWDYYTQIEWCLTRIICDMERQGMHLDLPFLRYNREKAQHDLDNLLGQIVDWAGVPISPTGSKDMAAFLFSETPTPVMKGTGRNERWLYDIPGLGLPAVGGYTDTGKPSMDGAAYKKLLKWMLENWESADDIEGVRALMQISKVKTQLKTFLNGLEEKATAQSRVHTRIVHAGPTSGRFASSNPNLQNITTGEKDAYNLRDTFDAPPGHVLVVVDWNQLEYRLLADRTKDPKLVAAFTYDLDLHSYTTYGVFDEVKRDVNDRFGALDVNNINDELKAALKYIKATYDDLRKRGKTLNFEVIYGVGPKKLADQLDIDEDEAKGMIEGWFGTYDRVRPWQRATLNAARTRGHIRTLCGRYRKPVMHKLMSTEYGFRGEEERTIINAAIQGSARDIVARGMTRLYLDQEFNDLGAKMIMQVHDEIVIESPVNNAQKILDRSVSILDNGLFDRPLAVPFPVSAGIGPTWASAKV